ncbi:MAG: hypothetical protein LBD08_01395 [Treponema sp.]|jgi:uncharacterized integral membrane protein|nr:hypothetical protein [Treponema sp.]
MPWRFLGFIIIAVFFLVFIGFNLDNRCSISFGFAQLSNVPVYLTALASFVLGLLCAVPILITLRVKKTRSRDKNLPAKTGKKRGKKGEREENLEESPFANNGAYGID